MDARKIIPARRIAGVLFILADSVRALRPTTFAASAAVTVPTVLRLFTERDTVFCCAVLFVVFVLPDVFLRATLRDAVARFTFADVPDSTFSFVVVASPPLPGITRDMALASANTVAAHKNAAKNFTKNPFISRYIISQKRVKKKTKKG